MKMKYSILRQAVSLLSAGVLAGCAISNEGASEYRRAELTTGTGDKSTVKLAHKYFSTGKADSILKSGNSLSVSLMQAYVHNFTEWRSPLRWARNEKTNGEVAVVIKAFEMTGDADFNFGPKGADDGRVVFFSADVEEGQFLNFSNMPVYGPVKYTGKPFALDIRMIEMDVDGDELRALMGNLAGAGAALYPPASPVLSVLNGMGKTFIQDDQNDQNLRFSKVLNAEGGHANLPDPKLEVGNYVIIREENRSANTDWSEINLDVDTGRLVRACRSDEAGTIAINSVQRSTYLAETAIKATAAAKQSAVAANKIAKKHVTEAEKLVKTANMARDFPKPGVETSDGKAVYYATKANGEISTNMAAAVATHSKAANDVVVAADRVDATASIALSASESTAEAASNAENQVIAALDQEKNCLFREATYLTFQINKGLPASDLNYAQNVFSNLLPALKGSRAGIYKQGALNDIVSQFQLSTVQSANYQYIVNRIADLKRDGVKLNVRQAAAVLLLKKWHKTAEEVAATPVAPVVAAVPVVPVVAAVPVVPVVVAAPGEVAAPAVPEEVAETAVPVVVAVPAVEPSFTKEQEDRVIEQVTAVISVRVNDAARLNSLVEKFSSRIFTDGTKKLLLEALAGTS
jgi:hypothetical protein